MKNSKIVILAGFTPSLINFRSHLIQSFLDSGAEVTACAPQYHQETINQLNEMGVKFKKINLNVTGLDPIKDILSVIQLIKLFRILKPDILFSYTVKPVIYGSIAAGLSKIPNIFSLITGLGFTSGDTSLKQKLAGFISRFLYKFSLGFNNLVFFQNQDDRNKFINDGLLKENSQSIIVNGSGVDLDFFSPEPISHNNEFNFLLIARLIKDKGIKEYVESARKIRRQYPSIKFNLLGYYYDNPNAISKAQIKQWTKEGIINYLGETDDVCPFIKNCSVYVLPSYREGTPRSVLEAMAMGRPIITTNVPGCKETVINGENGFLVPVKDVKALADAMEKFIKNPELIPVMGKRSREIAEEKYDVHKVNQKICEAMGLIN